jgi:dolichol-phosphate mannosyltransferase
MPQFETLVVLATYNEIENLPLLVEAIGESLPDADLLVIDDNSPDGTGDWCDQYAKTDSRMHCLHRAGKLGLGSAAIEGFRWALERSYRRILTMDADFSHPPDRLPALLAGLERADVTIGSRYCPGGAIEGWPFSRRLMSRLVNTAARWMLGLPVKDCSGAFRGYRAEILGRLEFDELKATGYAYLEEILWHLKRAGARFHETPITFTDRVRGQSKINWREAIGAVRVLCSLGWRNLWAKSQKTKDK